MNSKPALQSDDLVDAEIICLTRDKRRSIERRGKRALYDLPEELIAAIAQIAEKHHTTNSMVAGVLLMYGVREIHEGKLKLKELCIPCDSPRYDYKFDLKRLLKRWGIVSK